VKRLRGSPIVVGDRVRFTASFIRSTAQYTGPEAPTFYGPFARGVVTVVGDFHVQVEWDDGTLSGCHPGNLERCR
jgi:hypothetical protein